MENEIQVVTTKEVEDLVIELRGLKVLLDRDIAALYGVETKHVNQAVKNNPEKFPERYCFTLQVAEKEHVVKTFDRMQSLKKSTVEPRAFTEGGLYMLATILRSPKATDTTIAIIDAFTRLREFTRCIATISQEPDTDKQKSLLERSGELLGDLLDTDGEVTESESTIELNLAVLKIKRTVKKTSERKPKK
jgi:hypothetical protein